MAKHNFGLLLFGVYMLSHVYLKNSRPVISHVRLFMVTAFEVQGNHHATNTAATSSVLLQAYHCGKQNKAEHRRFTYQWLALLFIDTPTITEVKPRRGPASSSHIISTFNFTSPTTMTGQAFFEDRVRDIHTKAMDLQKRYTEFHRDLIEYIRYAGREFQGVHVKDAGNRMTDATFAFLKDLKEIPHHTSTSTYDAALQIGEEKMRMMADLTKECDVTRESIQTIADGRASTETMVRFLNELMEMKENEVRGKAQAAANMILKMASVLNETITTVANEGTVYQKEATGTTENGLSKRALDFKATHGYIPKKIVLVASDMRYPRYKFFSSSPGCSSDDSDEPISARKATRPRRRVRVWSPTPSPPEDPRVDSDGYILPKIPPLRFRTRN